MSRLYGKKHRTLQDQFGTRNMADKIEAVAMHTEIGEAEKTFIESQDMFWLATTDERGRPTVSYKGGEPGFVRVIDARTLAFPLYDGNGMFLSVGNMAENPEVGLLFIDFIRPNRLRIQGTAQINQDDPLMSDLFPGAQMVARIHVSETWPNCPRYVHRMQKIETSRYVPDQNGQAPLAGWKRVDAFQDALPRKEQEQVKKAGGVIPIETWLEKVAKGDQDA